PESARAVVVLLADEPEVATGAIRRVVTAWGRTAAGPGVEGRSAIVRARYDDRPGHPVLIATDRLSRLASRRVDRGLRDLFERGDPAPREVRVPGPAPADVDTEADYRALLARLRQR
ncbi:MAG: nucleotidyltransferase family protein, partial [Gemmatimonadota bacterium]